MENPACSSLSKENRVPSPEGPVVTFKKKKELNQRLRSEDAYNELIYTYLIFFRITQQSLQLRSQDRGVYKHLFAIFLIQTNTFVGTSTFMLNICSLPLLSRIIDAYYAEIRLSQRRCRHSVWKNLRSRQLLSQPQNRNPFSFRLRLPAAGKSQYCPVTCPCVYLQGKCHQYL